MALYLAMESSWVGTSDLQALRGIHIHIHMLTSFRPRDGFARTCLPK